MDGARLLVVCDVALGKCMNVFQKDFSLTEAPPGYDSVHGVSQTVSVPTDFEVFLYLKMGGWGDSGSHCNPSYSGGRDQKILVQSQPRENSS
jgi:hypothetical protein